MSEPNSVIAPIQKSWSELDALVGQLGDEGLMLTGADGWAVKDHLAHIAAWEASLIGLFEGSDRAAAMGIAASDDDGTDAINAAIWSLHRDKTPQQAVTYFRETHAALMRLRAFLQPLPAEPTARPERRSTRARMGGRQHVGALRRTCRLDQSTEGVKSRQLSGA